MWVVGGSCEQLGQYQVHSGQAEDAVMCTSFLSHYSGFSEKRGASEHEAADENNRSSLSPHSASVYGLVGTWLMKPEDSGQVKGSRLCEHVANCTPAEGVAYRPSLILMATGFTLSECAR